MPTTITRLEVAFNEPSVSVEDLTKFLRGIPDVASVVIAEGKELKEVRSIEYNSGTMTVEIS